MTELSRETRIAVLAKFAPEPEREPVPGKDFLPEPGALETLLAAPNEQFDRRRELLASVVEYMNAPSSTASSVPRQDGGAR